MRTLSVLILAALFVAGCQGEQDVEVIKLGHGWDAAHPVHKAMVYMNERLQEKSGGTMRIDIYPSEQLGSERECLELLQIGSLGMTKVSAAVLEGFASDFKIFSVPYLFRDEEHRFNVLEGEIGRNLLLAGEKYWLRGLTYYDAGSRSFYTKNRPVKAPDDLRGLKIRTMEAPTSIQMVNALGGSATPIAWGELYSALQQGVVDGAENNPPSFYLSYHYEVAKFFSLDEHTAIPDIVLISTKVWEKLTPQQQQWLQEAADESGEYQKVLWKEATEEALRVVQEAGVEIIYPEKEPFVEKIEQMYEAYKTTDPVIYDLIQKVRAVE
jgi:tripartite ATP-independent transporter DctP family solute receptor